jgi:hypothetical protein
MPAMGSATHDAHFAGAVAAALVTFNRHDYGRVPARFGITVLSPGETLRRMRA